jgi:hypothetical protein
MGVGQSMSAGNLSSDVLAPPAGAASLASDRSGHVVQVYGLEQAGGPLPAVRRFRMNRDAPRAARHFVADTLAQWGSPPAESTLAVDAAIVATELATNAVVHAGSDFTIAVSRRPGTLRIAVRDTVPVGAPLRAALGHGLGVVSTVATSWGAEPLAAGGKEVWAELPCPPAGSPPAAGPPASSPPAGRLPAAPR